uniref:Uncharacterized protein n=1 Tax=Rhizophora mucronata TaxID=61149 RepID=A0A2P2N7V4_RHIMU
MVFLDAATLRCDNHKVQDHSRSIFIPSRDLKRHIATQKTMHSSHGDFTTILIVFCTCMQDILLEAIFPYEQEHNKKHI